MAKRLTFVFLALIGIAAGGCASPTMHARVQPPRFADSFEVASAESWASVMPMPGIERSVEALSRRDTALGLPPPGPAGVAGAWRQGQRPTLESYRLIPLPRSERTLLFFGTERTYERRTPWVPQRAHPWRTAW